jgi:hypothetical protein
MVQSYLNPYVAGGPLSDRGATSFIGREDLFDFVGSNILSRYRTPILLYGHRRIGKTSLLRQIPYHLPEDLICVYYDLQGKGSLQLDQVLYGLGRAIADKLKITRPNREETGEEEFFDQFMGRTIKALGNDPGRLVLLLDEFDVIDERVSGDTVAARRFMGYLSELTAREPRIGYILVVGRKTEELSAEFNSTLLKGCVQKKITLLDEEQATRLVVEPSRGYLNFTPDALGRIYDLAAGQPFCTQVLCHTIWSAHAAQNLGPPVEITSDAVDKALIPSINLGSLGMNWIFDGLTDPAHRLLLSALAEAADPPTREGVSLSSIAGKV